MKNNDDVLRALYATIEERRVEHVDGSYTCYLFEQGIDKICKKVGEEAAETIIAAKNDDNAALTGEIADLVYHVFVLMAQKGVTPDELFAELDKRSGKTGNLKAMKKVDKNT